MMEQFDWVLILLLLREYINFLNKPLSTLELAYVKKIFSINFFNPAIFHALTT